MNILDGGLDFAAIAPGFPDTIPDMGCLNATYPDLGVRGTAYIFHELLAYTSIAMEIIVVVDIF